MASMLAGGSTRPNGRAEKGASCDRGTSGAAVSTVVDIIEQVRRPKCAVKAVSPTNVLNLMITGAWETSDRRAMPKEFE